MKSLAMRIDNSQSNSRELAESSAADCRSSQRTPARTHSSSTTPSACRWTSWSTPPRRGHRVRPGGLRPRHERAARAGAGQLEGRRASRRLRRRTAICAPRYLRAIGRRSRAAARCWPSSIRKPARRAGCWPGRGRRDRARPHAVLCRIRRAGRRRRLALSGTRHRRGRSARLLLPGAGRARAQGDRAPDRCASATAWTPSWTPTRASRPCATTPARTCCTRRCATCWART